VVHDGATTDLTRKFVELRSKRERPGSGYSESDSKHLLGPTSSYSQEKTMLPPLWVKTVSEIEDIVEVLKSNLDSLEKAHANRFVVRFDQSDDDSDRDVNNLTKNLSAEFRKADKLLKKISSDTKKSGLSEAEVRIRQNITSALALEIGDATLKFRKMQNDYRRRLEGNKTEGTQNFEFLGQVDEKTSSLDTGFSDAQQQAIAQQDDIIQSRDEDIKKIVDSVEELAQIFKELSVLVIDQGTILDRIDYNMEKVVERVETGMQELQKAETYQKNSRPLKCIILLLVLIGIMLAVLIVKHTN